MSSVVRSRGSRARKAVQPSRTLPGRLKEVATLLHRRWTLPVLAELCRGDSAPGGAKFITIVNRLGISRDSLAATLEHLIAHDYVLRNPGYGHPMRPEYLLAEAGHDIAPFCSRLLEEIKATQLEDLLLRKWSIPTLIALDAGPGRFGELKNSLPGITGRALTLALKDLVAAGLVKREVVNAFPPIARYRPAPAAESLLAIARDL
jgi:DNA-binding HxlR family transcriptional regulator